MVGHSQIETAEVRVTKPRLAYDPV